MKFFLPIVCLLYISQNILGHGIGHQWTQYYQEISYQDLININGSCFPRDSCMENREDDPMVPSSEYMCSCNTRCWEISTCCIDSPYRAKTPYYKCMDSGDEFGVFGAYMVYRCPDYTYSDSIWKNLCEKEWSGEDDILMLSPVSSLETTRTYKNYYCFKCHETTDKYVSWNLLLQSTYNTSEEKRDYSVTYDQAEETWMATVDDSSVSIPVNLSFRFPHNLEFYTAGCKLNMISDCPDTWTDKRVRHKCLAYTAVIYHYFTPIKNVHCAICNNISVEQLDCIQRTFASFGFKDIFSFRHLLNINDATRDKAGDNGKCDDDHLWDPYSKKCREKTCAIPGYVIKDNRCVRP